MSQPEDLDLARLQQLRLVLGDLSAEIYFTEQRLQALRQNHAASLNERQQIIQKLNSQGVETSLYSVQVP